MHSIAAVGTRPQGVPVLPTAVNAQRLVWIRMIALPGLAFCLLLARYFYGLPVPLAPVSLVVGALAVFNVWVWRRLRSHVAVSDAEFFLQMLGDLLALSCMLFFTGGATNPFVFFFLIPMTITAAVLPQRYTWAMAIISASCYTLLLILPGEAVQAVHSYPNAFLDSHVMGMWIGFIVITGVIAHFVAAMAETVRERDRFVANMRETALRDERVLAVATLAAGAAHELSTPLATMAVITGELRSEYPAARFASLHQQLAVLGDQISRCKEALSVISASAGVARADAAERLRLDDFTRSVVAEVIRLRPGANVIADLIGPGRAPVVVIERTVRQALLNVLHNAVDVSPREVRLRCAWDEKCVELAVTDRGGGFGAGQPGSLERVGRSSKEGGLGLGLFLTHAAVSQLGGRLVAENNREGGTTVTMFLPMPGLIEAAR